MVRAPVESQPSDAMGTALCPPPRAPQDDAAAAQHCTQRPGDGRASTDDTVDIPRPQRSCHLGSTACVFSASSFIQAPPSAPSPPRTSRVSREAWCHGRRGGRRANAGVRVVRGMPPDVWSRYCPFLRVVARHLHQAAPGRSSPYPPFIFHSPSLI